MAWVRAAARVDLDGREVLGVRCGKWPVALYALADGIYATSNPCPHMGALLSYGCVVQGHIECPMHHALFDIRTGASDGSVTDRALQTFPVKLEAGDIFVDLPGAEENVK